MTNAYFTDTLNPMRCALLIAAILATSAGCPDADEPTADAGNGNGTCGMFLAAHPSPCGNVAGAPYYTVYDGCNSCTCDGSSDAGICTARACGADAGVSDVFCLVASPLGTGVSIAAGSTSGGWYCDSTGRAFPTACVADAGP